MRPLRHLLPATLALALAACAAPGTGGPALPGHVYAPPPPLAAAADTLATNVVWTWQGTQLQDGTRIVPDAPERYSLDFQPGGRVSVRADCNRGGGSYRLDDSALSFGPIALTKMMCPPGSRDAEFLQQLAAVASQSSTGTELVLTLQGNAGSMRFKRQP